MKIFTIENGKTHIIKEHDGDYVWESSLCGVIAGELLRLHSERIRMSTLPRNIHDVCKKCLKIAICSNLLPIR